jgi:hypothetical protein
MQVFDKHGQQRDWAWLQANFGNVRFLDAGNVDKFALVRVDVTAGPAVVQVWVQQENGAGHSGQPVAFHWPDAPAQGQGSKTMWKPNAVIQKTGRGRAAHALGIITYIAQRRNCRGRHVGRHCTRRSAQADISNCAGRQWQWGAAATQRRPGTTC